MAPPSGAPNPPRGQAKKPVVPAIPYNLPHHQALHQRQLSQQNSQQIQKTQPGPPAAAPAISSGSKDQAVNPADKEGQKAAPPQSRQVHQTAAPTSSVKAPATTSTPTATSTILDKTYAIAPATASAHVNKSKASNAGKPPVGGATSAAGNGNDTGKPTTNGTTASSKKNHRHHGPKSNHTASRAPAAANPQVTAGGTHEAKSRKAVQQASPKTSHPKTQGAKNPNSNGEAVSAVVSPPHLSLSHSTHVQPSSSHPPAAAQEPSKDDTLNVVNTPTSAASTSESHAEHQPAAPTPQTLAGQDNFQPPNPMRAYENHPPAIPNGVNGNTGAEPPHFPSNQQHPAGPPVTMPPALNPNVSLVFGGFQESNTSSPAPPLSGGFVPPPPHTGLHETAPPPGFGNMNGAGHRRINSGPGFSGPPPMMPPMAPDFVPNTTIDGYRRHLAFAPFDGFPPGGEPYGPETPHSFQGSASPLFPERENGHMEAGAHQLRGASPNQFPPPPPGHFAPPMMNPQMPNIDTGDDMLDYIRSQFNDSRTADCTLEFRTTRAPEQTVHIHGHRLIFLRSPVLRHLLQRALSEQTGASPHILLETDDRNVTPVAFYAALQRIYGHPLLQVPHPSSGMDMAGTSADRVEYALAYAAAGHMLRITPVLFRGIDVASQFINWDTIEVALSFALADAPMSDVFPGAEREVAPGSEFKYGQHTQVLMRGIAEFLIHNWPRHFALDTSEMEICGYERLPRLGSEASHSRTAPPIARGTRPPPMNPSLRSIKFGDFAGSTQSVSPESTVLSRILLNLPFGALRFILESMAHQSPKDREKACAEVVAEREARRNQGIKMVYAGGFPNSAHMRSWLDQGGSLDFGTPRWSALGWKEYVSRHRETGLPCLARRWFNEPGPSSPAVV